MQRILIVDDNIHFRVMLQQLLEREKYEVLSAINGIEAMKIFRLGLPDLVISDLIMPEMEGIELITELRKANPNLKIIAVSGGNRKINSVEQLKISKYLGANMTFKKPIDPEKFVIAVRELLKDGKK